MPPLYCLLYTAKLNRSHFQCPDDDHLIIGAAGQVLPTGRKPHHIHRSSMRLLQIVLMNDLPLFKCDMGPFLLLQRAALGVGLAGEEGRKTRVGRIERKLRLLLQLPKSYA